MRLFTPLCGFLVCACSGASSDHVVSHSAPSHSAHTAQAPAAATRVLPLTFTAAGEQVLPVPMLVVSVEGRETRMIVDTGASHHVLTSEFANALGITTQAPVEEGRGHAGDSIAAASIGDVTARAGTVVLNLEEVYQADGMSQLTALGIGGFLSPQRLAGADEVVLIDFAEEELVLSMTRSDALRRLTEQGRTVVRTPLQWDGSKPFIDVAIDGENHTAELDTGGSSTEVLGEPDEAFCTGRSMSGACIEGMAGRSVVTLAGIDFGPVDVVTVTAVDHGEDINDTALVGMNLLRSCALVISRPSVDPHADLACNPPSPIAE